MLAVGSKVTVVKAIYEPADDCHPGGYLAFPGQLLIVCEVLDKGEWPIKVSHEHVTDGSTFRVGFDEIRAYATPVLS